MKISQTSFTKIMSVISGITLFIAAILVGVVLYWEFLPANVVTYPYSKTWPVINKTVQDGGYLEYKLSYCKWSTDVSMIEETLVGHNVYTLAPIQRDLPVGCQSRVISDTYIPPGVPPDKYTLFITVEYRPNPVRVVRYYTQTTSFRVTK